MSSPASAAAEADPYGILKFVGRDGVAALVALGVAPDPLPRTDLPLARGGPARPGDVCVSCQVSLQVSGMLYECPACHEVFEAADIQDVLPSSHPEGSGTASLRGRLRVVGRESGWYQPDMDRTNPGESSEQQKKATSSELIRFNKEYVARGGEAFPLNVLNDVAEGYYAVQKYSVKRSKMKKVILAIFVFHACIERGFSRLRSEVAELMQLPNHGIARGDDFLRSLAEDTGLDINLNASRLRPHTTTAFAHLGLAGAEFEPLRAAVEALVQIAEDAKIGYCSGLRSKVIAATAEVLRRKGGLKFSANEVARLCKIRINTLRSFLDCLEDHHSTFKQTYIDFGLDSTGVEKDGESDGGDSSDGDDSSDDDDESGNDGADGNAAAANAAAIGGAAGAIGGAAGAAGGAAAGAAIGCI
jgi:hypothetical protein